jgi:Cyclophilin type peptidyl-prolyl cis-trans isomerase/CLD
MADEYLNLQLTTGDVKIKLRPDLAPGHVERIKELANEGFYDDVKFHRVIDGFMAQGGCPNGTGMGGSDKPDLKAEFNAEPHVRGVCSMARTSAPHSACSTTRPSSTSSTPSGARSSKAWKTSTRCPRASRRASRARSSRRPSARADSRFGRPVRPGA